MKSAQLPTFSIGDLQAQARNILPRGVYDFLERGSEDEVTYRRNRAAFDNIELCPRVARDVSAVTPRSNLFGRPMSFPLAIAPTGGAGMVRYRGDVALAQAAQQTDIPFTISSATTIDLETLTELGARTWFQLYLCEDRALSMRVVDRAAAAGCEALIMTLDVPVPPKIKLEVAWRTKHMVLACAAILRVYQIRKAR